MLKEKKNNFYVKELNKIEQYIIRVFKRYFDVEELNNTATINFIVEEAIKRYKESINYERSGVDALNNKFGIVSVNIHDFGGEPMFDKKTAFNKDFGQIEDTVCEGNDPRLTDKREPTEHNHLIKHINGLEEILEEFKTNTGYYGNHIHFNLNILEKIIYNGKRENIDLIELEQLMPKITPILQNLTILKYNLIAEYEAKEKIIRSMVQEPEDIKKYIRELDNILEKEIKKDIPYKISNFIKESKEKINPYPNKELLDKIKPIANNNSLHMTYQYFNISNMLEEGMEEISSNNGDTMLKMYNSSNAITFNSSGWSYLTEEKKIKYWSFDSSVNSIVCNVNAGSHNVFLSEAKYSKYIHEVTLTSTDEDNDTITVILAVSNPDDKGRIYPLTLVVAAKNDSVTDTDHNFSVILGYGYYYTKYYREIAYDPTLTDSDFTVTGGKDGDWKGQKIRVRIERDGAKFKIYRSNLNSTTVSSTPCIEFDMSSYSKSFEEQSQYGYGCMSQQYSQFHDISFFGYTSNPSEISSVPKEILINEDLIDQTYNINTIEIQPELVYNNNVISKLPYITEDFIIDSGIINNNKMYARIQKLKEDVKLPQEIINGQIRYGIYAQKDLI